MKKRLIGLTLAIALVLALCLPAAARYIHCPYCWDGKVLQRKVRTYIGSVECDADPTQYDKVYEITKIEYCTECDYELELSGSTTETVCNHQ